MGAESFPADRQTDRQAEMTKLIVAFHKFAKAPNISSPLFRQVT